MLTRRSILQAAIGALPVLGAKSAIAVEEAELPRGALVTITLPKRTSAAAIVSCTQTVEALLARQGRRDVAVLVVSKNVKVSVAPLGSESDAVR